MQLCLKIYQPKKSLNIHITAVNDNITIKHQIEKEHSLRIKKVAKPQKSKSSWHVTSLPKGPCEPPWECSAVYQCSSGWNCDQ